jgi:hypothetical protein
MNLGYHSPIARATVMLHMAACLPAFATSSVVHEKRWVHGVTAHVVTVNLNDPRLAVTVGIAQRGIGHSEPLGPMMRRLQPAAAITGTFFCTRSLLPVGDIVTRGRHIFAGPAGTGFCVSPGNEVRFQPKRYGHSLRWKDCDTVLCTGPTLLRNGKNALYPRAEGYHDGSLWALRPRTAVGVTRNNKLLLVCVPKPIHLSDMRRVMRLLGCHDALGLDGGSSSALYSNGSTHVRPARSLTNVLMVVRTPLPKRQIVAKLP